MVYKNNDSFSALCPFPLASNKDLYDYVSNARGFFHEITDEIFNNATSSYPTVFSDFQTALKNSLPRMNVYGRPPNEDVIIDIAVPYFDKKEIKILTDKDTNSIKIIGKKEKKSKNDEVVYYVKGIAMRDFEKTLKFDNKYDIDKTKCTLDNGLLTITIPAKEKTVQPKELQQIVIE